MPWSRPPLERMKMKQPHKHVWEVSNNGVPMRQRSRDKPDRQPMLPYTNSNEQLRQHKSENNDLHLRQV